jgi:hypothetical protein
MIFVDATLSYQGFHLRQRPIDHPKSVESTPAIGFQSQMELLCLSAVSGAAVSVERSKDLVERQAIKRRLTVYIILL